MANEIEIRVTGKNTSGPAFKEPAADADKLKAKMAETAAVIKALGGEFDRESQKTDIFGERIVSTTTFAQHLDQTMAQLRTEARTLGEEFARTGNIDVFEKLNASQSRIGSLRKIKTDLTKALDDGVKEAGATAGTLGNKITNALSRASTSFVDTMANIPWAGILFKPINSVMESLPPQIQAGIAAAIIAAVIAASAFVGSAINAALLAAIGLGGITAGIIGQIKNPAVGAAFKGLIYDFEHDWADATAAFAAPLEFAAHIFAGTFHQVIAQIGPSISGLSLYVAPLAEGIQRLFSSMGPGLASALEAAGPILMALAQELPGLGEALSSMFASFSDGSQGATEGLRTLFWIVDKLVIGVGNLVDFLSNLYAGFLHLGQITSGWLSNWPLLGKWAEKVHDLYTELIDGPDTVKGKMLELGGIIGDTAVDYDTLAGQISKVTNDQNTLAAAMAQKMFSTLMNTDEATLHWHESLTSLSETLKQNGLAIDKHTHLLDENSKSGEQNRQAVYSAVQANMAQYQSYIASGLGASDAAAQYDANTRALEKQMRQAGYTQAQIDDLIGKYRKIPDTINTTIAMEGLTDAINQLDDAIRLANNLNGRVVTLTIQEQHRTSGTDPYAYQAHASGGIWGGMTWVGEQGRELVNLPQGSTVYPHGQSESMAGSMAAHGGSSSDSGSRTVNFVGDTDRAFARAFAQLVRDRLIIIS